MAATTGSNAIQYIIVALAVAGAIYFVIRRIAGSLGGKAPSCCQNPSSRKVKQGRLDSGCASCPGGASGTTSACRTRCASDARVP